MADALGNRDDVYRAIAIDIDVNSLGSGYRDPVVDAVVVLIALTDFDLGLDPSGGGDTGAEPQGFVPTRGRGDQIDSSVAIQIGFLHFHRFRILVQFTWIDLP